MMRVGVQLLLALLAVLAWVTPSPSRADPSDIAAAARSVVRVVLVSDEDGHYALQGHGSGFAVGPDLIVTNAHVVQSARADEHIRIGIVPSEGKGGWFAKVVAIAPDKDLALLRLTERGALPVATLFTGAVADGQDVFAVGYPGNVDSAQGLNVGDIVSPTSPVKTRGNVSAGRSSKAFETILHTAPLGAGNSGGPLLDACGRVLGANSFGTEAGNGDSEFYFAVSTREIMRFLIAFGVQPHVVGTPCRSIAELDRAEADRGAAAQARAAEDQRAATTRQAAAEEQAQRQALFEIAGERENLLGLAGVALLLALGCGVVSWTRWGGARGLQAKVLAGAGVVLLISTGAAMVARPGFDRVDERARQLRATPGAAPSRATPKLGAPASGQLICTLIPDRSRITVSEMADVPLDWGTDGCANGQTQYGQGTDGWSRVQVPDGEDIATVTRFDPKTAEYRVERYFLDPDAMTALRNEREGIAALSCGAGTDDAAVRRFGEAQAALRTLLPPQSNERLVYRCASANSGSEHSAAAL